MRTWQITGVRSGNTLELSGRTTSELTRYRRELEHAVQGIAPDAPVQTELRRRLDVVLAEQDEREKIAHGG